MLDIRNIEVVYSGVLLILKGVSLEVPKGAIVALLGANGAGKSTTLKAISGLLKLEWGEVTHGDIELEGEKISNRAPDYIATLGIRQVLEGRRLYEHLSMEENLVAGAYLNKSSADVKRRMEQVYQYFPRLRDLRHNVSGYTSGGEQQMLVIGRSLMAHPKVLLLDEPSLGLAPLMCEEIFKIIGGINTEEGVSILLVEQNAYAALSLAQHGYVMENGRIVLDGPSDSLKENEDIKEFYLGLTAIGRKSYKEVKHYKRRKRWLG